LIMVMIFRLFEENMLDIRKLNVILIIMIGG